MSFAILSITVRMISFAMLCNAVWVVKIFALFCINVWMIMQNETVSVCFFQNY